MFISQKKKKIKLYFYPIFLKSDKLNKINFLNNHLKIVNVRQIKKLRGRVAFFFPGTTLGPTCS